MERRKELAKHHSIPSFETCKELDWQHETDWCWVELAGSWVVFPSCEIYYLKPDEYFYAPYMHDIISRLVGYGTVNIKETTVLFMSNSGRGYAVGIQDNDIAEAFGQLCLLFRKNKVFKRYLERK